MTEQERRDRVRELRRRHDEYLERLEQDRLDTARVLAMIDLALASLDRR